MNVLTGSKTIHPQEYGDMKICMRSGYDPTLQPMQLSVPSPTSTGDWRFIFWGAELERLCMSGREDRQVDAMLKKMGLGLHTEWETLGHFFHSSAEFQQSCLFRVSPLLVQLKYTDKALLLCLADGTPFLPLATKGLAVGIAVNSAPALLATPVVTCFEYLSYLFIPTS